MNETDRMVATAVVPAKAGTSRTRTMLWVLLLVYVLNFLDRQIVNILPEPISKDLGLPDTQIGLMTGLTLALFSTVLCIPIACNAERPSPHSAGLLSTQLDIWSEMTLLCGKARCEALGVGEEG